MEKKKKKLILLGFQVVDIIHRLYDIGLYLCHFLCPNTCHIDDHIGRPWSVWRIGTTITTAITDCGVIGGSVGSVGYLLGRIRQ